MEVRDPVSGILKDKKGPVWSIAPDATVFEALELMADKEIGALMVEEGGELVGLLSERDYARKIILMGRASRTTTVGEIMASPPISVTPDCTVDEAMRTMTVNRVRHLPVLNGTGRALGIVSIGDCVKWVITSHEKTIEQLHSYIAGQF